MGSPREEKLAEVTRYQVHPRPGVGEAGEREEQIDSSGVRAYPTGPWRREVLTTRNKTQLSVLAIHAP